MFCEHYRLKISESIDTGMELPSGTLKHIAKCKNCRQYFDSIKKLEFTLEQEPEAIRNYNFDNLNLAISSKIDLDEPIDTESLHYPTIKYNHKFAMAATLIIAATLAFSIFVNSTTKIEHTDTHLANSGNTPSTHIETADIQGTEDKNSLAATPQMAIIFQLYSNLDKKEVKSTLLESKEYYDKTQEISEKSYDILNKALKNSHFISLLF